MDLMKMGQELLGDKLGGAGGGNIMEALSGLTGGSGGLDIGALAEKFKAGGLGEQLQSWLGDGENAPISADQLKGALGEEQIGQVASKLGVSSDEAAGTLSDALPSLLDKASSGGSLLDSLGGAGGLMDAAKGFLNK